jgi:hypothetical protein
MNEKVAEIGAALRAKRAEDQLTKVRAELEEEKRARRTLERQLELTALTVHELGTRAASALVILDEWAALSDETPPGAPPSWWTNTDEPADEGPALVRAAAMELRGAEGDEMHLKVSDIRYQAQGGEETTGILVRAVHNGRMVRADIAWLDASSLLSWLRAQGGDNPKAEATVGALLGFPDLQAAAEADE